MARTVHRAGDLTSAQCYGFGVAFSERWHCGADTDGLALACPHCAHDPAGPVFVAAREPCTRCGVRRPPWCETQVPDGTLCAVHGKANMRHILAPKTPTQSRAYAMSVESALDRWRKRPRVTPSDAALDALDAMAMEEPAARIAAALKAAQVAALTADTGAGQTVVMAPPDVRPIPAPIGVLRDELMRTLK